jgi:hypothetical protein
MLHKILNMLPESWETVKAVWRNDESMALDALLEKIINEERTRPVKIPSSENALFAQKRKRNDANQDQNKHRKSQKCGICKRSGHLAKDCWFNAKNKKCDHCRKSGHKTEDCWSKNKKTGQDLAAVALVTRSAKVENEAQASESKILLAKKNMCQNNWILDSGCTEHMTENRALFSRYEPLKNPRLIGVAGGSTLEAVGEGDINFGSGLIFKNVLFVPKLGNNLLQFQ